MPSGAMSSCFLCSFSESQIHCSLNSESQLISKFARMALKTFESNASLWMFTVSLSSVTPHGPLSLPPSMYICTLTFLSKGPFLSLASHQATTGLFLCDFYQVSFCLFYMYAVGSQTLITYFPFQVCLTFCYDSGTSASEQGNKIANGRPLTLLLICPSLPLALVILPDVSNHLPKE